MVTASACLDHFLLHSENERTQEDGERSDYADKLEEHVARGAAAYGRAQLRALRRGHR